jgi:hypothetical protein
MLVAANNRAVERLAAEGAGVGGGNVDSQKQIEDWTVNRIREELLRHGQPLRGGNPIRGYKNKPEWVAALRSYLLSVKARRDERTGAVVDVQQEVAVGEEVDNQEELVEMVVPLVEEVDLDDTVPVEEGDLDAADEEVGLCEHDEPGPDVSNADQSRAKRRKDGEEDKVKVNFYCSNLMSNVAGDVMTKESKYVVSELRKCLMKGVSLRDSLKAIVHSYVMSKVLKFCEVFGMENAASTREGAIDFLVVKASYTAV